MKKITYIFAIIATVLTGCEKFLDIKPVAEKPDTEVLNSAANVEGVLIASYNNIQGGDMFGGQIYRASELLGDNLDFSNITNANDIQFRARSFDKFKDPGSGIWSSAYTAIFRANIVIDAVDQNLFNADNATKSKLKGEALFIRAISHFELVRFFALPYSNNPTSDPGVIIRTKATKPEDADQDTKRNTVAEVYAQVIKDLTDAASILPATNPDRATSYAANALLARVYFSMNDFANAEKYSSILISDSTKFNLGVPSNASSAVLPFRNAGAGQSKGGVIFQMVNYTGYTGSGALTGAFWNQTASSVALPYDTLGYAGDSSIYHLLKVHGGRRFDSLVVAPKGSSIPRPFSLKYRGPSEKASVPVNVPVIRMAEMYLIRAESRAELGSASETAIRADYNVIRRVAGLSADNSTTGKENLIKQIRTQRRVELVLENDRYHELRRQKSASIRGFAYNDKRVLMIPLTEVNGFQEIEQNNK